GPLHGSVAPVEAEPDGPLLAEPMVRVFASARHDAQGHGYGVCAMVHRPLGRQAARPSQLHPSSAQPDPVQESEAQEGEATQALEQTCLRRSGEPQGQAVHSREILADCYVESATWPLDADGCSPTNSPYEKKS